MVKATTAAAVVVAAIAVGIVAIALSLPPQVRIDAIEVVSNNGGLVVMPEPSKLDVPSGGLFSLNLTMSSLWPVSIHNLSLATDNFSLVSNPGLPLELGSNTSLSLIVRAPGRGYQGNLVINLDVANSTIAQERISVPDVYYSKNSKTVTQISIKNLGNVPIGLCRVSLVRRSDGLAVNSTFIDARGLGPGDTGLYEISLSYLAAMPSEIYDLRVETAGGANATYPHWIAFCDC